MKSIKIYQIIIVSLLFPLFFSCDQWDEHVKLDDTRRTESIMDILMSNPEASVFVSILKKTGYDNLLSGDKLLTVFVPVNNTLQSVDMNDDEILLSIVRNHIAYLSYTVIDGRFKVDAIEMVNGKRLNLDGMKVEGVNLLTDAANYNVLASNGVLHYVDGVIETKLNIWEYLKTQGGYIQGTFISSLDNLEMDMEKSIQIGVAPNGSPLYDTVWVNRNPLLEECPIDDESQNYTFILLESGALVTIENKYSKYFARPTQVQRDSIVRSELIKDCLLKPVIIESAGRYPSLQDVLMDIDPAHIIDTYQASNGIVYKVSDANVKIYENKLKTVIIEAENYFSYYADGNAWSQRSRAWASGGQDMMLNGRTNHTVNYSYQDENDSTIYTSVTFNYHCFGDQTTNLAGASGFLGQVSNCYIEYRQKLHSVGYRIYWSAYDDVAWHYDGSWTGGSEYWEPARFSQKLMISFPDQSRISRSSDATFVNNFSDTTVFSSVRFTAGAQQEFQLYRHRTSTTTANQGFFLLSKNPESTDESNFYYLFEDEDDFGDKSVLISPRYGETTFLVANSTENKSTYSGMIFLDYIKLVPDVDVND